MQGAGDKKLSNLIREAGVLLGAIRAHLAEMGVDVPSPVGRPRTDSALVAAIREALDGGVSVRAAAAIYGVGISTVQRIKARTIE